MRLNIFSLPYNRNNRVKKGHGYPTSQTRLIDGGSFWVCELSATHLEDETIDTTHWKLSSRLARPSGKPPTNFTRKVYEKAATMVNSIEASELWYR